MLAIVLHTVSILILCFAMFSLGRLYELDLEIQKLEEEIEQELFEQEMLRRKAKILEPLLWKDGVLKW